MKCTTKPFHIYKRQVRDSFNRLIRLPRYNSSLHFQSLILVACLIRAKASKDSPELLQTLYHLPPGLCVSRLGRRKQLTKLPPTVPAPFFQTHPTHYTPKSPVSGQPLSYIFTILSSGVCS